MNEWEAKYKALLMAIDNPKYIESAEKFVKMAISLSQVSLLTFEQTFYSMREIINIEQAKDSFRIWGRPFRKWAKIWKRAAKKWRRKARWFERDNDHQRAIASQVPYLKERIKDLERQIPARTFDIEDYLE